MDLFYSIILPERLAKANLEFPKLDKNPKLISEEEERYFDAKNKIIDSNIENARKFICDLFQIQIQW